MHSPMARLFALSAAFALLGGCDTNQPLEPPAGQGALLLAAAQKAPSGLARTDPGRADQAADEAGGRAAATNGETALREVLR